MNNWKNKIQDSLLGIEKQNNFKELKEKSISACKAFKENMHTQKETLKCQMKADLNVPLTNDEIDKLKNDIIQSYENEISELLSFLENNTIDLKEFMNSYKSFSSVEEWPSLFIDVGTKDKVQSYAQEFQSSSTKHYEALGLLKVKVPPEQMLLQKLAENNTVLGVYDTEIKITAPQPPALCEVDDDVFDYVEMVWPGYKNAPFGITEPGKGIKICIIDTGIDSNNKAFEGKNVKHHNFTDDEFSDDSIGHGTHCAGIAAGKSVDDKYCSGVAPYADLLSAKVFGSGKFDLEAALGWACEEKADIVSLSLKIINVDTNGKNNITQLCSKLVELDIIVCIAAGNEGEPTDVPYKLANGWTKDGEKTIKVPGDARNAITVGAIDRYYKLADFSSKGPTMDPDLSGVKPNLVAPGVEIAAARAMADGYYNDEVGENRSLINKQGTSMACPVVAGAAAVILSYVKMNNIEISPKEIIEVMYDTANPIDNRIDDEQGHGLLNISAALEKINDSYLTKTNDAQLNSITSKIEETVSSFKESVILDNNIQKNYEPASYNSKNNNCCACNKELMSRLSVGGNCQSNGCKQQICSMCWKFKKIMYCESHR